VHDLESELNQARYENALMGRKCHGSYQVTAQAEAALHQAHQQMNVMNQELTFLRAEHARVQEELRLQKVHVGSHEERATQMEAQLKQAESRAARSEEVASDLHHWMLRSLHE
ncbi:degT, partial [Symbiodinium sp. CCMP2456]